ncbi:hypothetical protein V6N11_072762 [Hibiscus sabdariffa]|uniref:Uncharacterized protein n=2 Tax=Hibiscus sabdariffa TaxID=183260 RepID=A0ABR2NE47_9ROSI
MDLTEPTGYFVCGNEQCNRKEDDLFSYYDTPRCTCGKLMNVQATKLRQSDSVKDETEGVLYKGNFTLGSISNLFRNLNTIFSISNQKNSQLGVHPPFYSRPNVFPYFSSWDPPEFHFCYTFYAHMVIESSVVNKPLDPKSQKPSSSNSWGYVEIEKNSFVVTDDLVVNPLSSISSISLLKEKGISLDDVEQKVISIGEAEAIALVGACLWSSSALSALLNCSAKKAKQEPV